MKTAKPSVSLPLALALALLGGLSLLASCEARKKAGEGPARASRGQVVFLEGQVKVNDQAATIGMDLGSSFTIETGPASGCDLVFDGKNAIHVGPNALADLDLSKVSKEINLHKGGMAFVLKQLQKVVEGDSFKVHSPAAVAGVRGTSFCVWANEDGTYVCACNGTVETIDAKGGNEEVISSAHHSARLYTKKDGNYQKTTAGLKYHDDASVQKLADTIGYTIDWTTVD